MIRCQQYSWMLLQNFFKGYKNDLLIGSSFISRLFPLGCQGPEGTTNLNGPNQPHLGSLPIPCSWAQGLYVSSALVL